MATRNPANVIEFGKVNFGAPISVFAVAGATGVDAKVAPGEDLEKAIEAASQKGTVIGLGAESGGAFNLYMENSSWTAADLESAVQAAGGVFAAATVTDGGL
jgi:hypothetical protein